MVNRGQFQGVDLVHVQNYISRGVYLELQACNHNRVVGKLIIPVGRYLTSELGAEPSGEVNQDVGYLIRYALGQLDLKLDDVGRPSTDVATLTVLFHTINYRYL